jgi:SAM-dependent methyltransferase
MIPYNRAPVSTARVAGVDLAFFVTRDLNADARTVKSFGEEWIRFSSFTEDETRRAGDQYFDIVTPEMANASTIALDIGCGTGRWSKYLSKRVKFIEAVDPGDAVLAAVPYIGSCHNIRVTQAGYGSLPFDKASFDFVFSLGVVHHLPDTEAAIREAASMLKRGGWLLLYVYYNLDNRGGLYQLLFGAADRCRRIISTLPGRLKFLVCDAIAIAAYGPLVLLARFARLFSEAAAKRIPLSYYVDKPWKVIRNDSLDRFGTPLEKRFSRAEIREMLIGAGMADIQFSEQEPYWHVVARKP